MATERDETYFLNGTITILEATVDGLEYELRVRDIRIKQQEAEIARLQQQVEELKQLAAGSLPPPVQLKVMPPFVKPNVPVQRRKKPGRPDGHEAALRPMPARIDHHQDVPLRKDRQGRAICPGE